MSLVHFEINFYYVFPIAQQRTKDPNMEHVKIVTQSIADRFNCKIESDYIIDQDAILTCSEEDFIILMLTCPGAVKQSW
jgi:hypothetical protein